MVTCYLGLGSNLGKREENINLALRYIKALKKTKVIKASSFYETEPQGGPVKSPRFINAVAKLRTELPPAELFRELKSLEVKLGRKNSRRFYPRIIDLDILFYGRKKINLPYLKIPHPRIRERDFVLRPLKEVAPHIIKSLAGEIRVISGITQMRKFSAESRVKNKTIGFVPTMGYLHQGHLSLIRQAKRDCDICVVSIFVNPIQFGPQEDYKKYPRDLEQDSILAKSAGCDCIFYPKAEDMYPQGYLTDVNVQKVSDCLCGLSRPGHFKGVATVVTKLLNIVGPDIAYFGGKDYQQALLIKKMIRDLNMPLRIKVMPCVREPDGLALSSRNTYLNSQERQDAVVLFQSLQKIKEMIGKSERNSKNLIKEIKKMILKKKTAKIDYLAVVNAQTLEPVSFVKEKTLVALAVWIGKTRLIDNILL